MSSKVDWASPDSAFLNEFHLVCLLAMKAAADVGNAELAETWRHRAALVERLPTIIATYVALDQIEAWQGSAAYTQKGWRVVKPPPAGDRSPLFAGWQSTQPRLADAVGRLQKEGS